MMVENLHIIYNTDLSDYRLTTNIDGVIPEENLIVVNISHWTKEELNSFERKSPSEQIKVLEQVELFEDIKTRLSENPLV
jgi:hypothetical protein